MNRYKVIIDVLPNEKVLDPQGKAVERLLNTLGFNNVNGVRIGKRFHIIIWEEDNPSARKKAEGICLKAAAIYNPVMEESKVVSVRKMR